MPFPLPTRSTTLAALPLAVLLGCLYGPADARADERGGRDLTAVPIEQLMDMPVFSASRFTQKASEAPSSVRVITAAEIRDFGWRTLDEALASLPGVYRSYDRSYAYIGARGFLRPGDYNTRFLLLVNGVRTNDPVYDQAPVGSDFLVDMDLVERIEFVPGPGSASYGSNAFFGVINVVTRNGHDYPRPELRGDVDDRGGAQLAARYGRGDASGEMLLAVSGLHRDGEDLYYPEFDDADGDGIAHGRDDERTRRFLLAGSQGSWAWSLMQVVRDKGDPAAPFGQLFDDPRSNNRDERTLLATSYVVKSRPDLEWTLRAFAGHYAYDGRFPFYPEPGPLNVDGSRASWGGVAAQAVYSGHARHKVAFGIDAQLDWKRSLFNYDDVPRFDYIDESDDNHRAGIFVEDELRLREGLLLNTGLRADTDGVSGLQLSPRVALVRDDGRGTNVKLIAGSAYRSPNLYESAYTRAYGPDPDAELGPERIDTVELALTRTLGAHTTVSASLYRERLRDLIDEQVDDDGAAWFANRSSARTSGLELALDHDFDGGAVLRASYGFARAEGATGEALENSPRHTARLNWSTPLPLPRLRAGIEARWISAREGVYGEVAGHRVLDATLTWPTADARFELSATIRNLFDARYADPAGPSYVQNAIEQDGRTVFLRAIYRF